MSYIVPILILFIAVNTLLKISFWRRWQAVLFAVVAGVFVLVVAPTASLQSKTQLTSWLHTPAIMQNVAVLITVDTVILLAFTFIRLRTALGTAVKPYTMAPLNAYPGLLLFPALFYVLAQLFFSLPGVEFGRVARVVAVGTLVIIPLLSWWLSRLLPEEDLRLEIQFTVSLLVCFIGLISTVNGETAYLPVSRSFDAESLLAALILFVLLFGWGFLHQKYRKRKVA